MDKHDFDQFAKLLDGVYDLLGNGATKVISAPAKTLFFKSMETFSLAEVRAALSAHCIDAKAGKFPPRPAELIDQIDKIANHDGRPGGEEAWAKALTAQSESDTVVWTQETAAAFLICQPVLVASGAISARKTFLEAYARLVINARFDRLPVRWSVSLGSDPDQRITAIRQALHAGLLSAKAVAELLPPERSDIPLDAGARIQLAKIHRMMATRRRRVALVQELRVQRQHRNTIQQKQKLKAQFDAAVKQHGRSKPA